MGNYNGKRYQGGGGGSKDFKADPLKQYLISRGCARDRAVDLCCSGKIELADIPVMTDKLTILHFGCIEVSPKVDAEVMRIAARLKKKLAEKDKPKPDKEPEHDLCDDCVGVHDGCTITDDERPMYQCDHYYSETDAQGDANKQLQDEADDRQRAEEEAEASLPKNEAPEESPSTEDVYTCTKCDRKYKTAVGLAKHVSAKHGGD